MTMKQSQNWFLYDDDETVTKLIEKDQIIEEFKRMHDAYERKLKEDDQIIQEFKRKLKENDLRIQGFKRMQDLQRAKMKPKRTIVDFETLDSYFQYKLD